MDGITRNLAHSRELKTEGQRTLADSWTGGAITGLIDDGLSLSVSLCLCGEMFIKSCIIFFDWLMMEDEKCGREDSLLLLRYTTTTD